MSTTSRWLDELHRQVMRGKHIVLHGDVQDYCLRHGEIMPATEAVRAYLGPRPEDAPEGAIHLGFPVVAFFDLARGLMLPERARRILFAGAQQAPERIPDLLSAAEHINRLLTQEHVVEQDRVAAAVVIRFGDRVVGDAERQAGTELQALLLLKEATERAAGVANDGVPLSAKNLLVLIASDLRSVPAWFFRDNPWVALVKVPLPRTEERRFFLESLSRPFHPFDEDEAPRPDPAALATNLTQLAEHSDGLALCELDMVRRMSITEQMSVCEPRRLVDLFKYGTRENPWELLHRNRIDRAREILRKRVIGQEPVVDTMVDMLKAARIGINMSPVTAQSGRPRGVFFFVGPTGVGKTEMAKALTELVFNDEAAFARFDMSEFAAEHSAARLTGSEPGFVGYLEGGQLTNRVLEKPFSVLLFDEIEKAHGRVLDKFLQVFEDGRLTDGQGRTAYFSECLLIFTSNIGSAETGVDDIADSGGQYEVLRQNYLRAVHRYFVNDLGRPELLSRLGDNILVFDVLRQEHIHGITAKLLRQLAESARRKYELSLTIDQSVYEFIRTRMGQDGNMRFGGRRIKSLLETHIERPLNVQMYDHGAPHGRRVALAMDSQRLEVSLA